MRIPIKYIDKFYLNHNTTSGYFDISNGSHGAHVHGQARMALLSERTRNEVAQVGYSGPKPIGGRRGPVEGENHHFPAASCMQSCNQTSLGDPHAANCPVADGARLPTACHAHMTWDGTRGGAMGAV